MRLRVGLVDGTAVWRADDALCAVELARVILLAPLPVDSLRKRRSQRRYDWNGLFARRRIDDTTTARLDARQRQVAKASIGRVN